MAIDADSSTIPHAPAEAPAGPGAPPADGPANPAALTVAQLARVLGVPEEKVHPDLPGLIEFLQARYRDRHVSVYLKRGIGAATEFDGSPTPSRSWWTAARQ
jgi:hypothetical protein